jgi:uncharacterized membrane protein YkoI
MLVIMASSQVALGDDERHSHDHDVARQALEQGEVLPLQTVLAEVRNSFPGEVAGIELEHEHGAWTYEIKVIGPGGVLTEVKVNATTGRILRKKEE